MPVDIEAEFAGELEAIQSDFGKAKSEAVAEAVAAKEAELASLRSQLAEAQAKAEAAQGLAARAHEDGRKDGAAAMLASVKRRLEFF